MITDTGLTIYSVTSNPCASRGNANIHRNSLVVLCALAAACGTSDERSGATSRPAEVDAGQTSAVPRGAESPAALASGCPHTGRWALCNVESRLKQAGFVVKLKPEESPTRVGFSVKPVIYGVGRARLEVFIYDDEAALARDIAKMDTVRVAPVGANATWETPPLLIRSGNLAAVFLTDSPQQAERLALALTAGAPQPGSPR